MDSLVLSIITFIPLCAAAIMALVYVGGDFALLSVGVPDAVTGILQGILLISYLACSLLLTMRLRWVKEEPA